MEFMKLQQLQVLVAVVDTGGIRAASRQLNVSQAAVTKAMKALEETVGTPLLLRRARGVTLTDAGTRMVARARVIARQVALAHEELRQTGGADFGSVRLGITPYLTLSGLGEAFRWFRERYRNVEVVLIEGLMTRVIPRLRDGTLDIAVVAADVGEIQEGEFNCVRMQKSQQCIVVREGHPVLADPTAKALASLEWIFTQPVAADAQPRVNAMFALAGVTPPSRVVQCESLAAMTLLRNSDAVSIFPVLLLGHPETRGLVAIEECPLRPSDIELLLLTQPDVPLTPAAHYFAHCLTQVSGDSPQVSSGSLGIPLKL
jgi:LysR family transcriptional regulator of abg operon